MTKRHKKPSKIFPILTLIIAIALVAGAFYLAGKVGPLDSTSAAPINAAPPTMPADMPVGLRVFAEGLYWLLSRYPGWISNLALFILGFGIIRNMGVAVWLASLTVHSIFTMFFVGLFSTIASYSKNRNAGTNAKTIAVTIAVVGVYAMSGYTAVLFWGWLLTILQWLIMLVAWCWWVAGKYGFYIGDRRTIISGQPEHEGQPATSREERYTRYAGFRGKDHVED